jgi:hypothetical protein
MGLMGIGLVVDGNLQDQPAAKSAGIEGKRTFLHPVSVCPRTARPRTLPGHEFECLNNIGTFGSLHKPHGQHASMLTRHLTDTAGVSAQHHEQNLSKISRRQQALMKQIDKG